MDKGIIDLESEAALLESLDSHYQHLHSLPLKPETGRKSKV